ncbi:MAG: Lrp/AsnC family transcriptional regulator [archaeon]|nr:Lrp/AsnC family transcriptional regulator [archaeon]
MSDKKNPKIDETDKKILTELKKNGRESFRTIAQELGIATGTVSKRVNDMKESGVIKKFSVKLDYEKLGYDLIAIIELRISKGKLIEVEKEISKDPHIIGVYDITGTYDASIFVRTKTRDDLNQLIKKLLQNKYIERTNTHFVLNVIKDGSDLVDQ